MTTFMVEAGRGHLSGDLKWRHAEMSGIIILPNMQQLRVLKVPIFSVSKHYRKVFKHKPEEVLILPMHCIFVYENIL